MTEAFCINNITRVTEGHEMVTQLHCETSIKTLASSELHIKPFSSLKCVKYADQAFTSSMTGHLAPNFYSEHRSQYVVQPTSSLESWP